MQADHLVWYCGDLARGCAEVAAAIGVSPAYGGEHPGEGTANALLSLGPLTYLEILGRDPAQPAASLDAAVAALEGSGLYHWAVSGENLETVKERCRRAGLTGGELVRGGRIVPDGRRLQWTCFGLRGHGFGALVPFAIDWHDTPHPAMVAPSGVRLARLELFTPEPQRLVAILRALGVEAPVTARDEAGMAATLEGPGGSMTLASYSAVPTGYII